MNKKELIELRNKLLYCEKYVLCNIDDKIEDTSNIDICMGKYFLEDDLKKYNDNDDLKAINYFEDSIEELIRILVYNNIEFDEITTLVAPMFFIKKSSLDNNTLKKEDIFYDKVRIVYDFEIKNNNNNIKLPQDIDIKLNSLPINYNNYVLMMKEHGFDIKCRTFDELLETRYNNEDILVRLKFEDRKELIKK